MTFILKARTRDTKTQGDLSILRADSMIPAVVYGHGSKNQSISFDMQEFDKLYNQAGTSNLIDLMIDDRDKALKVLISEVQHNPITDNIVHVDLHQIRMDEKIHTQIELEFIGESPAVKSLGGNLIINRNSINVECLPQALVPSIKVDITTLQELDQNLHIKDLIIPEGITVLDDAEGSVASVLAPRVETEPVVAEAEAMPIEEGAEPAKEGEDADTEVRSGTEAEDKQKKEKS